MSFRLRCRRRHPSSAEAGAIFLHDNKTVCTSVKCHEGELVQDIVKSVCHHLDIPPLARFFFALCYKESGIPLNPYSRLSKQECASQYRLRVFVNISNSCYLQCISVAAYDYYYKQACYEFVHSGHDLHPHVTLNSAVWMAAINMAMEAKAKPGRKFEDFQSEIGCYMPVFLQRRYKRDYKVRKKMEEVFERFVKLDVDRSHYVQKFLEVLEKDSMCGHHVFHLKKAAILLLTEESEHVTVSWRGGINVIGVVAKMKDCQELMCSIADISTLTADFSCHKLTISKTDKTNFDLHFSTVRDLVGFSTTVQGYWWMKVDGSHCIFRGDLSPSDDRHVHCGCATVTGVPSHYDTLCYAPITDQAVHSILKKHFVDGNYLIRESRTTDDAYTLCVCHDKRIVHYRIVRGVDGFYYFKNQEKVEDAFKEHQKFATLHDLIKNHKHKCDGLPTFLRLNISPDLAGGVPLLPPLLYAESAQFCSKSEYCCDMRDQPLTCSIQCQLCLRMCSDDFAHLSLCECCDRFYCMNCVQSHPIRDWVCQDCQFERQGEKKASWYQGSSCYPPQCCGKRGEEYKGKIEPT